MTVTVKRRDQLVVPASVQRRARIKAGDRLQFKVSGGMIMIIPELALRGEGVHSGSATRN